MNTQALEVLHAFDNINQSLKQALKHQDEVSKEQLIKLLEECVDYFAEKRALWKDALK